MNRQALHTLRADLERHINEGVSTRDLAEMAGVYAFGVGDVINVLRLALGEEPKQADLSWDADEEDKPEDSDERTCEDCGRSIRYDNAREAWRHVAEPERGCFMIEAEPA
jgi:hypothetical protein